MRIKYFDNIYILNVTSSKSKGKVSNNDKRFKDCLMSSIDCTQLPEIVEFSPDIYQTKFPLVQVSLDIKIMADELKINQKKLPRKHGKDFTKRYAIKKILYILVNFIETETHQ